MSLSKNDREFIQLTIKPLEQAFTNYTAQHQKNHAALEVRVDNASEGARNWLITKDRVRVALIVLGVIISISSAGGIVLNWSVILKLFGLGG